MDNDNDTSPDAAENTQDDTDKSNQKQVQRTVPYSRFKEVNDEARRWERQVADLSSQLQAANKRIADAEAAQAKRDRDDTVRRIARDAGLPEDMAARLQGDDEAGLKADAEALAAMLKPSAPDIDAREGKDGTQDAAPIFTRAQIRDPKFYAEHVDEIYAALADGRIADE